MCLFFVRLRKCLSWVNTDEDLKAICHCLPTIVFDDFTGSICKYINVSLQGEVNGSARSSRFFVLEL